MVWLPPELTQEIAARKGETIRLDKIQTKRCGCKLSKALTEIQQLRSGLTVACCVGCGASWSSNDGANVDMKLRALVDQLFGLGIRVSFRTEPK